MSEALLPGDVLLSQDTVPLNKGQDPVALRRLLFAPESRTKADVPLASVELVVEDLDLLVDSGRPLGRGVD